MSASRATRFGKYLLLDRIAVGGMAEIHRGKITGEEGFTKLAVIKKILPHLNEEPEVTRFFIDEAKLAARLQHPNIIQVYDFGTIEGSYFIAMEYLSGKDLKAVLDKAQKEGKPLGLSNVLYIGTQICSGLHYAHSLCDYEGRPLNIIHRDLSPQNIFLTYDGQVKIIDFGIAKAADQSTHTQQGIIKGKVAYMSPEQAEGKVIDHRSDLFAAGIILYELLTGKRMFHGDSLQVLSQVKEARFEPPENLVKDLPPPIYTILRRALAKDPARRYQSAGEMLEDLEECIHSFYLRPGAEELTGYLQGLFTAELATERQIVAAAMHAAPAADQAGEPSPDASIHNAPTIELDTREPEGQTIPVPVQPPRRRLWLAAASLVLLATVIAVGLLTRRQADSVSTVPETAVSEPATPAPLPLAKPDPPQAIAPERPQTAMPEPSPDSGTEMSPTSEAEETMAVAPETSLNAKAEPSPAVQPPPPQAVDAEAQKQAKVERFLRLAEESLEAYRLTKPADRCAYYYYRKVEKLDPGNKAVRRGYYRIGNQYAELAEKAIQRRRYSSARRYIATGLEVRPNHPRLLALRAKASPPPPRQPDSAADRVVTKPKRVLRRLQDIFR
jgi:tRNA A-37 threonylcarbamoyl transferase component Bud32